MNGSRPVLIRLFAYTLGALAAYAVLRLSDFALMSRGGW